MKNIIVYDNGGETVDRYTVIIGQDVYGMSHNPTNPQGFNQYLGNLEDTFFTDFDHLLDKLAEVPKEIESAVRDRLTELPF